MIDRLGALLVALTAMSTVSAQGEGDYLATLTTDGGALEFGIEIKRSDASGDLAAFVVNGEERLPVPHAAIGARSWVFEFPHYDSRLMAAFDGGVGSGRFDKTTSGGATTTLPLRVVPAADEPESTTTFDPSGRWAVRFSSADEPAVGVFESRPGGAVRGTFLTSTGDYRFLAGRVRGDEMTLSCFDGAHAFLFKARRDAAGRLSGDFWSGASWHETWTAVRDDAARLADPFAATVALDDIDWRRLVFADLDGKPRSLADPAFAARARLIVIFGSWCPNCHDQGRDLARLLAKYRRRGLGVVGLACELSDDHERSARQIRRYLEHHGGDWPVLVAGPSDKAKATEALRLVDRLRSFPTTLFVDAGGRVRHVHQGYCGPATGADHEALTAAFEARIDALLDEPLPKDAAAVDVVTWNIRYASADGDEAWSLRRPRIAGTLTPLHAEIIATQECLPEQARDLAQDLPDYDWVGEGRDGDGKGEMMAVFFRRDRFECVEVEHRWLSETPQVPGSKSWDSACTRMATRLRLRDRQGGREIEVVDTHLDHVSARAREKAARLLRAWLRDLGEERPIILLGDFNAPAGDSKPHAILTADDFLVDSRRAATWISRDWATFNGFLPRRLGPAIDWILLRGFSAPLVFEITAADQPRPPSDHHPVHVRLR